MVNDIDNIKAICQEALDNTFKVVLYDTPLTFWEEVLEEIKPI